MFLLLSIVYLLQCLATVNMTEDFKKHLEKDYTPSSKSDYQLPSSLPPPPPPDYKQCKLLKSEEKFDCYPDDGPNAAGCEARGCCWVPGGTKSNNVGLNVPRCFYPPNYQSYRYVNVTQTHFGFVAFLRRKYRSAYGGDVETIKMIMKYEAEYRLRIKFVDPLRSRFEPPYPKNIPFVNKTNNHPFYKVDLNLDRSGFRIIRKSDNTTIFDSYNLVNMVYSDQFLQISGKLPSHYIYGLGEHRAPLLLPTKWQRFTMFNSHQGPSDNTNLYGSHPFYLSIEPSGNSHGVFLLNSNAMDVILQPTPAITFRPIGGILDLYFFMGPSPGEVISQYTEVIGRPFLPPYWALGFHLCRSGYKTLNKTIEVMERTIAAKIPLDAQWSTQEYMDKNNVFTYDKVNFHRLPAFVDKLHDRGMHYVPVLTPDISSDEKPGTYYPFDYGVELNVFVRNSSGQIFFGKVWNRTTAWPDFTYQKSWVNIYWYDVIANFFSVIEFDGIWLDMNEPSNFISGSLNGCPKSRLETPPYLPAVKGGALRYKTLCMTAQHSAGAHYNVHNLYAIAHALPTQCHLQAIRGRRRLMMISRSSFPGLGQYSGHWSGDIGSTWTDMKFTIPQILNYNMFGIPFTGADICGFKGDTTVALCNRWSQLGAFYPFSRNHNGGSVDQDPVALGPLVVRSTRRALSVRYSLLPYLFNLFFAAFMWGETVARPLFFEFTNDTKTYHIDDQFLWGAGLMILPVLEENATSVLSYFPAGVWYDYYTKQPLLSKGEHFNISAPLDTIPLFIRGGYILPMQSARQTTTLSMKTKIKLLAASDTSEQGHGSLYWVTPDHLFPVSDYFFTLLSITLKSRELKSEPAFVGREIPPHLGSVKVLGLSKAVSKVFVNQVPHPFRYVAAHKYLLIRNLDVSLENTMVISWQ